MSITGMGEVAELASTVIGRMWPDKTESERAQLAAALTVIQGQLEVNKAEAASNSLFKGGWRPFIGWVCGAACAWNWIGLPIAKAGLMLAGYKLDLAQADLTEMLPILIGMLGLAGLRSAEKFKSVAS